MVKFGPSFIAYLSQKWSYPMELLNIPTLGSSHSIRKNLHSVSFVVLNQLSSSGEYGMGTMANELSLGCDCLGQIHYLVCLNIQGSLKGLLNDATARCLCWP